MSDVTRVLSAIEQGDPHAAGMIERANLDGTDPEVLVTGLKGPTGIALDLSAPVPEPGTLLLLGIGTRALLG